jgi:hypothetical protein
LINIVLTMQKSSVLQMEKLLALSSPPPQDASRQRARGERMRYRALCIVAGLLAGLTLTATTASAGGWLADTFVRPFDPKIADQLDHAHREMGQALEHSAAPATAADIKALMRDLSSKSEDDLLLLSFSSTPCSEISCHNAPHEIVVQLIRSTLDRTRALVDLEVRRAQALAAVASASIALLSLGLSIVSLRRTRASAKESVEHATVASTPPVAVSRNS